MSAAGGLSGMRMSPLWGGDALVGVQHGSASANDAVALSNFRRHTADLESSWLALVKLATIHF